MTEVKQIVVGNLPEYHRDPHVIYGLGDDSLVYEWDFDSGRWRLFSKEAALGFEKLNNQKEQ